MYGNSQVSPKLFLVLVSYLVSLYLGLSNLFISNWLGLALSVALVAHKFPIIICYSQPSYFFPHLPQVHWEGFLGTLVLVRGEEHPRAAGRGSLS